MTLVRPLVFVAEELRGRGRWATIERELIHKKAVVTPFLTLKVQQIFVFERGVLAGPPPI
jgi:hypothetical protein